MNKNKYSLAGLGLGIYLIILGFAYLVTQFSTAPTTYLAVVVRLYPLPLLLLGIDYLIRPGSRFGARPGSLVVTLIIFITILGLFNNLIPGHYYRFPNIIRRDIRFNGFNFNFFPERISEVRETFTKSDEFALPAAIDTIKVENSFGDIDVRLGGPDQIEAVVTVTISAPNREVIEDYQQQYQITGKIEGEQFLLKMSGPGKMNGVSLPSPSVDWTITIPATANLEIVNSFGDIEVAELQGSLLIMNSNGELNIGDIQGDIEIENRFGDVTVAEAGHDLRIDVNNGDIDVSYSGGYTFLKNSFGKIKAGEIRGDLEIIANNSKIDIEKAEGASRIENSFANVRIDHCRGPVEVILNNGDLDLGVDSLTGDYDLKVKFGDLNLGLPGGSSFTLTARVSHGELRTDYPLDIREDLTEITAEGEVNGGGSKLDIEVQNGNLKIR